MKNFRPFYYSANLYNSSESDPDENDIISNCQEWQKKLGTQVLVQDIYKVLYNITPEQFQQAYEDHKLTELIPNNSFIKELEKKSNKELLEYIRFSKELEYYNFKTYGKWESWEDENRDWFAGYEVKFKESYNYIYSKLNTSDQFLRLRYAFQRIKICYYQNEHNRVKELYLNYFERINDQTILVPWAMLYYAHSEDKSGNHIYANYLYSRVFDLCESKKYVAMQWFNKQPEIIEQTLSFANNDIEKANIISMACFRNPGPAIDQIKMCYSLGSTNNYFTTLVAREINKIEDWILTPQLTEYAPSVELSDEWYTDREAAMKKNLNKDKLYLQTFKIFLISCQQNAKAELKDFLSLAIAHLCFINNEMAAGQKFIGTISANTNESILIQKNVELCLIKLRSSNILDNSTQTDIANHLKEIEQIAKSNHEYFKTLYSLTRIISKEYRSKNKNAIAGLLFMRSEIYKDKYEMLNEGYTYNDEGNFENYYYWPIAYFDRYATLNDMTELIALLQNKNKTIFQQYITTQYLPDINVYKDLKATIAFRNNDLSLTEDILKEIPSNFWDNNYEFKNYLNEDPFLPKRLSYAYKRDFTYHFNKYDFIKKLNKLLNDAEQKKDAASYLLLGHAFYNCSYWGNAWMMTCYGKGSEEDYYYSSDYQFGSNFKQRRAYQEENYFKCTLAKKYYTKACELAINNEQKAMANLMIHCCKEAEYDFYFITSEDDQKIAPYAPDNELIEFYKRFKNTDVFRKYKCPEMDQYIAKIN
ncbi:MAG: hypothetical protein JNL24_00045 [Bacteroidia bacterium]|nr:hypothetical protein [Bacteroidia bacterium]